MQWPKIPSKTSSDILLANCEWKERPRPSILHRFSTPRKQLTLQKGMQHNMFVDSFVHTQMNNVHFQIHVLFSKVCVAFRHCHMLARLTLGAQCSAVHAGHSKTPRICTSKCRPHCVSERLWKGEEMIFQKRVLTGISRLYNAIA